MLYNINLSGDDVSEMMIPGDYNLHGQDLIANSNNIVILGNQQTPFSGKSEIVLSECTLGGNNNENLSLVNSSIIDYAESLLGERIIFSDEGVPIICGWRDNQNDFDIMFLSVRQDPYPGP